METFGNPEWDIHDELDEDEFKPDLDPVISELQEKILVEMYLLGLVPKKRWNCMRNDIIMQAYFYRFVLDEDVRKSIKSFREVCQLYHSYYPHDDFFTEHPYTQEYYFLCRSFEFKGEPYIDGQGNVGYLCRNLKTGEIVIDPGANLSYTEGRLSQAGLDYIMNSKLLEKFGIKKAKYLIWDEESGKKIRL